MYNDTLFVSGPPKYWNGRWHQLFIWSLKKAILLQHIETAREDGSSKPMRIFSPFKEYCCCSMPRSCLTLCNRMDCSLPGTSVHGIYRARILELVAISSSRGSSQPKDQTHVAYITGRLFTTDPPGKPLRNITITLNLLPFSSLTQSCPTLCDPVDCNLPGSSVRGIFQARILEWVTISFSRGSSQPRDLSPALEGDDLTSEPGGKPFFRHC